jgi:Tol biopolymer transport system component
MRFTYFLFICIVFFSCKEEKKNETTPPVTETPVTKNPLIYPEEKHFKDLRQVTFGGDNAEAYWSFDDKQLVFQSNNEKWNVGCDQMFLMNADETFNGSIPPMISTGKGRTTCAYFLPDNKHIFTLLHI